MSKFGCLFTALILIVVIDQGNCQTCSPTQCPRSIFDKNLGFNPDKQCYDIGDNVTFNCSGNQIGPPSNTCDSGGPFQGWTIPPGTTCEVFTCARPTSSDTALNFSPDKNEYNARETLTYSCSQGYILTGTQTTTCDAQDTWNPATVPVCNVICDPPNIASGGLTNEGPFTEGSTATVECDDGYGLASGASSSITCQNDSTWDEVPQCYQMCNVTGVDNSDTATLKTLSHGEFITITCNSGYSYNQLTWLILECDNGNLDNTVKCYRDCGARSAPNNGGVSGGNLHGETITFTCNQGYYFNETASYTCNDGTWENGNETGGNIPTCYIDGEDPTVFCIEDISQIVVFGSSGTAVTWVEPTAVDNSGLVSVQQRSHAPGDFFLPGSTNVTYVFADPSGNTATCTFAVTVTPVDNEDPTVNCIDDVTRTIPLGTGTVIVFWTEPTATDNSGSVSLQQRSHAPGSTFQIGTTVVTYTFVDPAGNTATCIFSVIVDEVTPQTTTDASREEHTNASIVNEELDRIAETNLTDDNVLEVAQQLERVSGHVDIISAENVESIIDNIEKIVQFNVSAEQVINITGSVVTIANNIIEVSSETLNDVTDVTRVPLLLEEQAAALHLNGQNYSEVQENVGVSAIRIHGSAINSDITFGTFTTKQDFTDVNFRLSESNTGFRERFGNKQPRAAITLPSYILGSIEKGKQNSSTVPLSFLVYRDATLFPVKTNLSTAKASRDVISSHVISATVAVQNVTVNNLPNNSLVTVEFYSPKVADDNEKELTRQCVFWKYDPTVALGEWSTEGCNEVTSKSTDTQVVCACDHLTSFAVLVRIVPSEYDPPTQFVTIVTTIGCVLSVAGLCLCIVTILTIRPGKFDKRARQQVCIHLNLCLALLGLYLTFLIGIDRTQKSLGCKLIASSIHFFCLASMSWMSVEAFNMFMLFWKMRRTQVNYLIPTAIALAWGVPLAVAVILFFSDDAERNDYCFLHPSHGLYFGFILPIFILFLFNAIVYVLVTYRVTCRKIAQTSEEAKRREKIARVKGSVLFWILLGMCWTFGVLAVIVPPLKIIFDVLFSICLALQGVFMFVLLVLNNPEIPKTYTRIRASVSGRFSYSSRSSPSNTH